MNQQKESSVADSEAIKQAIIQGSAEATKVPVIANTAQ